ncbi:tetratricopeptide repeat protein [Vibrio brasiliensis]|uniref:tetratricopeptide repeat protein n=1 Tax=Vibrio brasiliensis TaxID=170652 RepID=UPI001EFE7EC1|nr:tetratricopeptide repeat protein [Vibrio brasiliensis]MCG9647967.1 tetratricopeptide repeat protein [Vibrio brasiliensis]
MSVEQSFRTVTNLRKAGQLQEAWNVGFTALEQSPHDAYLKGALFWICYEYIKQQQEKIAKRAASSNNFRPSDFEFERIENLLQTIVSFDIPPGGWEYKMLLVQFKKNLEWFPSLVNLVLRHQGALFDDESKKPFPAEKGEVPSLMLSTARQMASAWLRAREFWQLDLNQVLAFINLTRQQVSDLTHLIWLDYDQSKCLIAAGDYEQARKLLLPILRKKQKEAWAWGALAATYRKQDRDLAIKFFAKGIVSAHDVIFSLKLLQGAIPLLLAKQQIAEASMCLKTALQVYQSNGWRIKPELERLMRQTWYDASVDEGNLNAFLKALSRDAAEYLHGPMEKVIGIVENIHQSGKGFQVFVNRSATWSVRMGMHKNKQKLQPGDYVELSLSMNGNEKEVVESVLCQPVKIADVGTIEGVLRIAQKGFGFVDDTFVPAFLVGEVEAESRVTALRIMAWDKAKARHNWKAIKLTQVESTAISIPDFDDIPC